jgi:hypothetical protein
MAHDRQLSTSDMREVSKPSRTSSATVADWLSVFGKVYREELSEELVLAYQLALSDLRDAETLHAAFMASMKKSKFRPTPAEILDSYAITKQNKTGNRPKYLDEPQLTPEEREAELASPEYQELRKKIQIIATNKSA